RLSGASGKVPSAIHVAPEAAAGGPLARVRDGDILRLDADAGTLEARVDAAVWEAREPAHCDLAAHRHGCGRELFARFRDIVGGADSGASVFDVALPATAGGSASASSRPATTPRPMATLP